MPKPRPPKSGNSAAVDRCVKVFRSHMHLPDTSPVFAALGCIAANYLAGPPVWLMLVSPPSSGKTQIINSCVTLPYCREAGQCKNSSAFLTYYKERGLGGLLSNPQKDAEGFEIGGIGEFGILLYTEFSVILGLPPDQREEVIATHRQLFDGRYSRQYGANGGRMLEWEGKCGALGAVTGAIDDNPLSGDLGERWIYYRFPPSNIRAQANSVLSLHGTDPAERNMEFRAAVLDVMQESGVERGDPRRELLDHEEIFLADISSLACRLRGTIRRDRFSHDIIATPQIEGAGRITYELAGMYLGTERIGIGEKWRWKLIRKIAVDSAPAMRMEVLKSVRHSYYMQEEATTSNVASRLKFSRRTAERCLEDLEKLEVLEEGTGKAGSRVWKIDPKMDKLLGQIEDDE